MLMTVVNRNTLPSGAIDLLELMEQLHKETGKEWLTRSDMAQAQGKRLLNASQLTHLDYLYSLGFVDIQRPIGSNAYEYRVISEDDSSNS